MSRKRIDNTRKQSYSLEFERSLKKGDLIEFKRTPLSGAWVQLDIYSHWGVYYGDGEIGDFNTVKQMKVNPKSGFQFLPAAVKLRNLKDVAGSDDIKVNNKLENPARRRSQQEIVALINFLIGGAGFEYSLFYFNCEHFATYIVFDGISISDQMANLVRYSTKRIKEPNWSDRLAEEAYRQWKENEASTGYFWNRAPQRFLPKYIEDNKSYLQKVFDL